jgi:alpha-D-ribose 1-methylphosphonate 5-triphosphate synthase subunit PhnG
MKKFIFGLTALLFSVSLMTGFAAGGGTGAEGSDKEADRKAAIKDKKAQKKADKKEKKAELKKKKAEDVKKKPVKKGKPETKPEGQ